MYLWNLTSEIARIMGKGALCLAILVLLPGIVLPQSPGPASITDRENLALQEYCERMAELDIQRLGAALERLKTELIDLNCDPDSVFPKLWQSDSAKIVRYLAGPYYGWRGTTGGCATRIRIAGDEICSCALRAPTTDGKSASRRIFRINVKTGEELPPMTGPCYGEIYGEDNFDFSVDSMIDPKECKVKSPQTKKLDEIMKQRQPEKP